MATVLPADASGAVHVEVPGEAGAWVNQRLVDAWSSARAQVLSGRVVYAAAPRGMK